MTDIFLEGGRALIGSEFAETSLLVSGTDIAEINASRSRARLAIKARDLLVLPGIVDLHGDAFERQMMPRAGVDFPIDVALADSDRQAISNGITTVFHATTCSWEPGLRSAGNARSLMEAIERQRPQFAADTRFHLCHETYNLDAETEISQWLTEAASTCSPSTTTWTARLGTWPSRASAIAWWSAPACRARNSTGWSDT